MPVAAARVHRYGGGLINHQEIVVVVNNFDGLVGHRQLVSVHRVGDEVIVLYTVGQKSLLVRLHTV